MMCPGGLPWREQRTTTTNSEDRSNGGAQRRRHWLCPAPQSPGPARRTPRRWWSPRAIPKSGHRCRSGLLRGSISGKVNPRPRGGASSQRRLPSGFTSGNRTVTTSRTDGPLGQLQRSAGPWRGRHLRGLREPLSFFLFFFLFQAAEAVRRRAYPRPLLYQSALVEPRCKGACPMSSNFTVGPGPNIRPGSMSVWSTAAAAMSGKGHDQERQGNTERRRLAAQTANTGNDHDRRQPQTDGTFTVTGLGKAAAEGIQRSASTPQFRDSHERHRLPPRGASHNTGVERA